MIQICECNIFFPCAIDYFIGKDLDQQQCIEKKEGCVPTCKVLILTYYIEWKSTKMSIAVHATNQTLINFRQTIELRGNNQSEDSINKYDQFEID